jgi:Fic family protein
MYIYELPDWPNFHWDAAQLEELLASTRYLQGQLNGQLSNLGFYQKTETTLLNLTADVIKTSEIEDLFLNPDQVRSSVAKRLGIDAGGLRPLDREQEGIVDLMLDATQNFAQPLTLKRLTDWHSALFPAGKPGIQVGVLRDDLQGPMQVVSGGLGKENIHFQAPPANTLNDQLNLFLTWFETDTQVDPLIRSGIAHLWFVTIHPFDDGNGRIARAIADLVLARAEQSPHRFYSLSSQIRQDRQAYYRILELSQRSDTDLTAWLTWYLSTVKSALSRAQESIAATLQRAHLWESVQGLSLNPRQKLILTKLLENFQGHLTSSKYAKLAKCSQDTAHRDIQQLLQTGVLVQNPGGGRNTSYSLQVQTSR